MRGGAAGQTTGGFKLPVDALSELFDPWSPVPVVGSLQGSLTLPNSIPGNQSDPGKPVTSSPGVLQLHATWPPSPLAFYHRHERSWRESSLLASRFFYLVLAGNQI